ncbi:cytochrome b562 [Salmonella enterica subsp. enterica serovar Miami]|nr:cytochrome b562 [Salmonella enterica]EBU8671771.1 cytochrome b562 [Salmonella enterica subsp. enterica serovar Panama]EEE1025199.1 cytochrome b562 [Salmonella enterica subsp. enterica serovar Miami]EFI4978906.1 cytochrome b562 [Salmonella enterica]EFQ8337796.1 cytochrome b562 [Salmonella enterica]
MKRTLKLAATGILLVSSMHVSAADLEDDMDILAQNLGVVQTTTDTAKMKASLENMRNAALDAQKSTPPKLDGKSTDSTEMKDYRYGLNVLIGQIDKAMKLTDEGKITEAHKVATELKETRNTYHSKYR